MQGEHSAKRKWLVSMRKKHRWKNIVQKKKNQDSIDEFIRLRFGSFGTIFCTFQINFHNSDTTRNLDS